MAVPVYSVLITAAVFILGLLLCLLCIKGSMTPTSYSTNSSTGHTDLRRLSSMLKSKPAKSLSLCLAAGFLYESDPQLKQQVNRLLLKIAEDCITDLAEQHDSDK